MGQTVYVDLFFMINFSMDFLCLFLTSKILNRRMSTARALLAGVLGGIYADLALLIPMTPMVAMLADCAVCALLCGITFYQRKRMRSLPLYILVFVAVSMALGGFMTALFHLLNRSTIFAGVENASGDGISVWIFALLAIISAVITLLGGRFFTGRTSQKNAEIEVFFGGRSTRLRAMTDNGNLLREPISGRPCIVIDIGAMSSILPREIIRAAQAGDPSEIASKNTEYGRRIRLIPTHTASGDGLLLGLRADRILVECGKDRREVDAMIALSDLGGTAGGNEALLPARLLVS